MTLALVAGCVGPLSASAAADTTAPSADIATGRPVTALSLSGGLLSTAETGGGYYTRQITTGASAVTVGDAVWKSDFSTYTYGPWSTGGDGGALKMNTEPVGHNYNTILFGLADSNTGSFQTPAEGGTVQELTGRYGIVNGANPAKQYIGDISMQYDSVPSLTRSITAASIWGGVLWTPTSKAGVLARYDLQTFSSLATVSTGASCVPKQLQAVGRWVYWSCGTSGPAGVWDSKSKKRIAVPSGTARLGDGFLVRQVSSGALRVTDFADGSASTTTLAGAAAKIGAPDKTWTVDRFGGLIAYVDADGQVIHLVGSGVATQALAVTEAEVSDEIHANSASGWTGWWALSEPVSSWKVTFTRKSTGKLVRTLTGGAAYSTIKALWDGKSASGAYLPNGTYTWKLTAVAAGGAGETMTRSGTAHMIRGAAVARDYVGIDTTTDGLGDLLTLSGSGSLVFHAGTGATGRFGQTKSGAGWSTKVKAVPIGDLSGDRCNDVLVRLASGTLRLYKPGCGAALKPSTPYTSLGAGWNQYDVLTSPGDITGDGLADLIARKSSNGAVYLYKGTSAGTLSAPVKLYSSWAGYKKIVGAGDLNGDGYGDLLAQDKSNVLWRYNGTASGTFKARVKVSSGWGSTYNAVVGVGDITGDGKADLVARDTSGNLYRQSGNGKGGFGSRTKIATGWKAYTGLF